jgi:hypothetical protein
MVGWNDILLHKFEITPGMLFMADRERLKRKITEDAGYKSLRIIRAIEVMEDYLTLKNAIDAFKQTTGIRAMEDFIESKLQYVSLLETCHIQAEGVSGTLDELLPQDDEIKKWKKDDRENITINYLFWDANEVSTVLTELKKTIMDYTKQIDFISTTKTLVAKLHPTSIELLGL